MASSIIAKLQHTFHRMFASPNAEANLHRWCMAHVPQYTSTCDPMKKVDEANEANSSCTHQSSIEKWNGEDLMPQDIWPSTIQKNKYQR